MNNAEWKHLADSGDSGYWSAEDQNHYKQTEQAITAVQRVLANEALEKMAENARELGLDYEPPQEPVAWINKMSIDVPNKILYTAPKRTWVGLTDEEILSISADCASSHQHTDIHFAQAIEAALKAKNT